jgi:hypothetical protein
LALRWRGNRRIIAALLVGPDGHDIIEGARMPQPAGFNLPLSLPRRFLGDLLHFAKQIPSIPVQRRVNVSRLRDARGYASPRPSWCAIFTKAFAIVSQAWPQLRRCYVSFPTPHLYQHPASVASIAIERPFRDGQAVFFAHLANVDTRGLTDIDDKLRQYKTAPVESIGTFRRALRVSRLPGPLRRLLWWLALNLSGRHRARIAGTFGVSVYAGLGAASLHPLSVLTTTLNYGVIEPNGDVDVRLIYDHRVLDGATVARALADLESVLNHEILAELQDPPLAA